MTKKEFLRRLKRGISPLDRQERQRLVDYYDEMIDDRVEYGKTEEEAVEEIGSPEVIAIRTLKEAGIDSETSESWLRKPDGKIKTLWIVLLIVGSPLWFGLACGLFGLLIGLFCAAVGVFVGIACACLGSTIGGLASFCYGFYAVSQNVGYGLLCIGGGLCALSLGILCSVGVYKLSIISVNGIKNLLRRRKIKQ